MSLNKKYLLFLIIFLCVLIYPVFSSEESTSPFILNLNLASVGYGGNFPLNDGYRTELFFNVASVGLEHRRTGLGFDFSPFASFDWSQEENYYFKHGDFAMSLFNLKLFWNVISIGYFYTGPFTAINYMFVNEKFFWDQYIFTAGLQIGIRLPFDFIHYYIASGEIGYRNINGIGKYYMGVKIDLVSLSLFVIAFMSSTSDEPDYHHDSGRRRR